MAVVNDNQPRDTVKGRYCIHARYDLRLSSVLCTLPLGLDLDYCARLLYSTTCNYKSTAAGNERHSRCIMTSSIDNNINGLSRSWGAVKTARGADSSSMFIKIAAYHRRCLRKIFLLLVLKLFLF